LACTFLTAATSRYEVTLLAKRFALQFPPRHIQSVEILFLDAPWTAFKGKYRLQHWPWGDFGKTISALRSRHFDIAVSARFDPRDHFLIWLSGAKRRVGFSRMGSSIFLTESIGPTNPRLHRFLAWQRLSEVVGVTLPDLELQSPYRNANCIVVHTGAGHPVRVWPLPRYAWVVQELRKQSYRVQVVCDSKQRQWWLDQGEISVAAPRDLLELCEIFHQCRIFIGNDSGPGHVAALLGLPTFTIFGPQLPESFSPIHPSAEWSAGKPCDFKPCHDSCHFDSPHCLADLTERDVWPKIEAFAHQHLLAEKPC
jgi:ADP-heptose:LPS heptosyltransferase